MLRALCAIAVGLSAFIVLYLMLTRRSASQQQIARRLQELRQPGLQARGPRPSGSRTPGMREKKDIPFRERVLLPLRDALERTANQLTPVELRAWLKRQIVLAGKTQQLTPGSVFASMMISGGLCFGMVWIYADEHSMPFLQMLAVELVGTFVGMEVPLLVLQNMIKQRKKRIMKELPEVLDLLCVSVQAGLSFDASLEKITARMHGDLIDEFRRFQDDVRMGMVRRSAMKALAARCELQDVSLFMTALIQAERLGTSMGKTLRSQADNIRERRRQYVKAEAMKAPVKIVFPLVLFIFPAIFVVTLVPTLLFLIKNM